MVPIGIVIHHTAGDEETAAQLRAIFKARFGINFIGYHRVISKTGEIWSDISDNQMGVHNNGGRLNNTNSVGISVVGNFEVDYPSDLQLAHLTGQIREVAKKFNIHPQNIVGHRDMKATACPGRNLYPLLPKIISKALEQEEDMGQVQELEAAITAKNQEIDTLKASQVQKDAEIANLKAELAAADGTFEPAPQLFIKK